MLKNAAFPAKMELLPQMQKKIMDVVSCYVSDDKLLNRLKVCAEEILVNIIDYSQSENLYISCEYLPDEKSIRFEFVDEGQPYNPLEEKPDVDIDAGIDERGIGGLGIFLYTTIMDKVEYRFEDGKNHLVTIKKIPEDNIAKPRRKIGVLIESDFYEPEIEFYSHVFNESGLEVHFLTRLWGNSELTFTGHEERKPFKCSESFEELSAKDLKEFAAVIIPAGYVSDRLRYTEDVEKLPPACKFLKACFDDSKMIKGIICHGSWLVSPISEVVRGKKMVVHNNLLGDAKLMGIDYVNQDLVVDGNLVSARTGGEHKIFAEKIIELVKSNSNC